ncbi:MAG: protein kinase [Victivallaceae bacterium]
MNREEPDKTMVINCADADMDTRTQKIPKSKTGHGVTGKTSKALATVWGMSRSFFEKRRDVTREISLSATPTATREITGDQLEQTSDRQLELVQLEAVYEEIEPFCEGGQGIISKAADRNLRRQVVIKSLKKEFLDIAEARRSFLTEAKVTAQLDHPAIVPIYSLNGDEGNGLHLSMKLINGMTLLDYLERIRINYQRDGIARYDEQKAILSRLELFIRICEAMSYAHSRNIMHCDLKPENVMIGEYRETYIMDWGIARHIKSSPDEDKEAESGRIAGTPRYLAPELLRGEKRDQRADIYALGVMLFEVVFLKTAFSGHTEKEVLQQVGRGQVEPLEHQFGVRIDTDLKAIIWKAISFKVSHRYHTVEALLEDLRRYLRGEQVSANPDNWATKTIRWAGKHRRLMLILTVIGLFAGIFGVAVAFYQGMTQAIESRKLSTAIGVAYSRCADSATQITMEFLKLERALDTLSSQAVVRLDARVTPMGQTEGQIPLYKVYDNPATRPPGTVFAKAYNQWIDPERICYQAPPGLENIGSAEFVRLAPLVETMRDLWLNSDRPVGTPGASDEKAAMEQALDEGKTILWIYLALADGLQFCYPGNGAYEDNYDSRTRSWYTEAAHGTGTAVWSDPYFDTGVEGNSLIITCSQQMLANNKLYGVAAVDVSLDRVVKVMKEFGNKEDFVLKKMLINSDGNILVDSREIYAYNTDLPDSSVSHREFKPFPNRKLFSRMFARRFGAIGEEEAGRQVLYVFAPITPLNWIYVEKINLAPFITYCNRQSLNIEAMRQLLEKSK